jgi:hypothetical protein
MDVWTFNISILTRKLIKAPVYDPEPELVYWLLPGMTVHEA